MITSISSSALPAAAYATNRYSSDKDPALAELQQTVAPPPQTVDETETERPVEEVTAAEPDRLSATTEEALRSRYQMEGVGGDAELNGGGLVQGAAGTNAAMASDDPETSTQVQEETQPATWAARSTPYSEAMTGQGPSAEQGNAAINLVA